ENDNRVSLLDLHLHRDGTDALARIVLAAACGVLRLLCIGVLFHKRLDDFRSERGNVRPSALSELACDRTEDTVSFRTHLLTLLLDDNDGVVVEGDIRTVSAAERLLSADDNCLHDILLLHRLARLCGLDGDDDNVAKACVAA